MNKPPTRVMATVAQQRETAHKLIAQHGACLGIICYQCPLYLNNTQKTAWSCMANDETLPKVGYMKEAVAYLFKTREQA
jgi:hypothetical protein